MKQFFLLVALTLSLTGAPSGHTAEVPSEYQVKAAYLYNFAKFIHWPEEAFANNDAPLVIGVLGENPFNEELAPVAKRQVRNRSIEIKQFKTVADINNCQLLFVGPFGPQELRALLQVLSSKPIVTVSDENDFVKYGGVIQLVTKRDRLRFIVNLTVSKANEIKIDSQLLSLAVGIVESKQ